MNIPDHEGQVYLPEVMWPLFHSQLNVGCRQIEKKVAVKKLMQTIKKKFPRLKVNLNMDELCGNLLSFDIATITAA